MTEIFDLWRDGHFQPVDDCNARKTTDVNTQNMNIQHKHEHEHKHLANRCEKEMD